MTKIYDVVTSLNNKYWTAGSDINIKSWDERFPKNVKIHIYAEDDIPNKGKFSDRVVWHNLYKEVPELLEFIHNHQNDPHYNGKRGLPIPDKQRYKYDGVKFAHKTFAIFDAANYAIDYLIWVDADVLCFKPFDDEFLEKVCPNNYAVSYLGRPTTHSECGFVGYNMNYLGKEFIEYFKSYYQDSKLSELAQTHDSFVFDVARSTFGENHSFFDLNAGEITNKHPFHKSALREHLVHNKGHNKERKQQKFIKRYKL